MEKFHFAEKVDKNISFPEINYLKDERWFNSLPETLKTILIKINRTSWLNDLNNYDDNLNILEAEINAYEFGNNLHFFESVYLRDFIEYSRMNGYIEVFGEEDI